jgi:hypothetical protein
MQVGIFGATYFRNSNAPLFEKTISFLSLAVRTSQSQSKELK